MLHVDLVYEISPIVDDPVLSRSFSGDITVGDLILYQITYIYGALFEMVLRENPNSILTSEILSYISCIDYLVQNKIKVLEKDFFSFEPYFVRDSTLLLSWLLLNYVLFICFRNYLNTYHL